MGDAGPERSAIANVLNVVPPVLEAQSTFEDMNGNWETRLEDTSFRNGVADMRSKLVRLTDEIGKLPECTSLAPACAAAKKTIENTLTTVSDAILNNETAVLVTELSSSDLKQLAGGTTDGSCWHAGIG